MAAFLDSSHVHKPLSSTQSENVHPHTILVFPTRNVYSWSFVKHVSNTQDVPVLLTQLAWSFIQGLVLVALCKDFLKYLQCGLSSQANYCPSIKYCWKTLLIYLPNSKNTNTTNTNTTYKFTSTFIKIRCLHSLLRVCGCMLADTGHREGQPEGRECPAAPGDWRHGPGRCCKG